MNLSEYRKTVKYIIKLLLVFVMMFAFALVIRADNDEIITTEDNPLMKFTETDITGDTDFSELLVTVVKQAGEKKSVIYKGKLGGYDNGRLNFTDFSTIDILICADYDTLGEEWIYVIPDNGKLAVNLAENSYAVAALENLSSDIKCNVNLMYDNVFRENVMLFGKNLNVPITVTNSGNTEKTVACYISEYDESGRMIGAVSEKSVTVPANTSAGIVVKKTFNSDAKEAKIFLWDKETGKPLTSPVIMNDTEADYFGNTFLKAQELDISYHIEGKINASSDMDYIKIVPSESGEYTFSCVNISGIICDLYDEDKDKKIKSKDYFTYSLRKGRTYYIKVYGTEAGAYILSAQRDMSEEASEFNIYEFDEEINIYKKSILEISKDFLSYDAELSKQIYKEYRNILADDAKLHELPSFLKENIKSIEDFDETINCYFRTRYLEFQNIRERYLALIDEYVKLPRATLSSEESESTIEYIGGKFAPQSGVGDIVEENEELIQTISEEAEPDLTIVSTTKNSITCNATFPGSRQRWNQIFLLDFNAEDGLTVFRSVYEDHHLANGEYVLDGLVPGGIYVVQMVWSEDGTQWGGENSICRFVQLPYEESSEEELQSYHGDRVTAVLEPEDKALANDSDFNLWLDRMDLVYRKLREFTGYTPFNSARIEMRSTRENLNDFVEIEDGYNYWETVFGYYDSTDKTIFHHSRAYYQGHMRRLEHNDWGDTAIHELSHIFDKDCWNFDSETLAQLKTYYILEQLNAKVYRPDRYEESNNGWYVGDEYYDLLRKDRFLDSYHASFEKGWYSSEGFASILIDIQRNIGWEPFKQTFRYFSKLSWSQVPDTNGDVLKLFLTQLREFSEHDVLDYISDRDKEIIEEEFDITLGYVDAPYGEVEENSGGGYEITEKDGEYTIHQFTPKDTGSYCISTSVYSESGGSNDTFIEVYEDSVTGDLIASNDDYNNSMFSKVTVFLTAGTTYYIKVGHSGTGQLHADLNIIKDVPAESLTLGAPVDIIVASRESALYSFTPSESLTYIFEVSNYNGESDAYDTYIKLYNDANLTNSLVQDNNKIMVNLEAEHTYYLKFSGFFMEYAKGRITVRKGQTLEFLKRNDSSFIYVNNPEFITKAEIVDAINSTKNKLFEQKNIVGKNTYYQTHVIPDDSPYYPTEDVYVDVDFYNPNDYDVTVQVNNLAYGTCFVNGDEAEGDMRILENYISGGIELPTITIPAKSHALLFGQPYFTDNNSQLKLSRVFEYDRMCLMFDFEVTRGEITVSSLAAHNRDNLILAYDSEDVLENGTTLANGEVAYGIRDNEPDLYDKYKGIATNQSNCIEANLEFAIDDNTANENLKMKMRDDYYGGELAGLKYMWMTETSPIFGGYNAPLYAMPGNLHKFTYHYEDTDRLWNFDFEHKNTKYVNLTGGADVSLNDVADITRVNDMKEDVPNEQNTAYPDAVDENALGMGSWGVVYRYNVTIANNGTRVRQVDFKVNSTNFLIVGSKLKSEDEYSFNYYPLDEGEQTPATFYLPAGETTSFEIVTLYGLSDSGLENSLVINEIE